MGHNYIGTEHILLGLVREGDGVAAQVLVGLGADLSRVRQQVLDLLSGYTAHRGAQQAGAAFAAPVGPRCGRCGAGLAGSFRHASAEARPADEKAEQGRGPLSELLLVSESCVGGARFGLPVRVGVC